MMHGPDTDALLAPLRIVDGSGFRLAGIDTGSKSGLGRKEAEARTAAAVARLTELQALLHAEGRRSLLVVLQAMDAGGKDGTIKHVMSGVNPQGVDVHDFKQPGPVERAHDFLWRIHAAMPSRGRIGILNRSHYEDVLAVRVHPELLEATEGEGFRPDAAFWARRFADIVAFERYLAHQGTTILKFFLHISKEEQRERLLSRLDDPARLWKFSRSDLAERARWDDYQFAYEEAIRGTSHADAPWIVVPADHKWHARLVVGDAINAALEALDPQPPRLAPEDAAGIEAARRALGASWTDTGHQGQGASP